MTAKNGITRRDFLMRSAAGTAGLSLAGAYFNGGAAGSDPENLLAGLLERAAGSGEHSGCHPWAPRSNLLPHCRLIRVANGPGFQVESNGSIGCHGGWELTCGDIEPGRTYRVKLTAHLHNIPHPVEDISPEIFFMGSDDKIKDWYFIEAVDKQGERIEFEHRAVAPPETSRVVIRLILRWTAHGSVTFTDLELTPAEPQPERKLRVAVASGLKTHKTIEANITHCLDVIGRENIKVDSNGLR